MSPDEDDKFNRLAIGVDLGGTNLRAARVDEGGKILHRQGTALPQDKSPEQIVRLIVELIEALLDQSFSSSTLVGVGIGAPGGIYASEGVVTQSPHFPLWKDVPLACLVQEKIKKKVWLDNDANCFALGESHFGHAFAKEDPHGDFLCLTLGTGIGGAMIINGKIWHGETQMAGEFGHVVIDQNGPPCACGSRGCLEVFASGSALLRRIKTELPHHPESILFGQEIQNGSYIEDAARKGDGFAQDLLKQKGRALGIGIANLVNATGICKILLGGKGARNWDFFIESTHNAIETNCFREVAQKIQIRDATLGDNAGILGAASLVFFS